MPAFEARMRVVHVETWVVYAKDADQARRKFSDLAEDVETDDSGGEVVDWEITALKEVEE